MATKSNENIKPIEYKQSKLEKTLKLSNEETLAKAIQDLLRRDSEYGNNKK